MLTKAGAKLLDFGLAKARAPAIGTSATTMAGSQDLTATGLIIGTVPYMAPEQIEGKEADARTDLFAFGSMLFEMVTGRKAFQGDNHATLMVAILEREPPPLSSLQPRATPALERIVRTCLAKDPDDRWQTARDLMRELQWLAESDAEAVDAPATVRQPRRRWTVPALTIVTLGAVAAGAYLAGYPCHAGTGSRHSC